MLKRIPKDEFLKRLKERNRLLVSREENQARRIVEDVAKKGDRALFGYTKKFDGVVLDKKSVKVTAAEIKRAKREVSKEYLAMLKRAAANIENYHIRQKEKGYFLKEGNKTVGLKVLPIERVGVYVPGGLAAYPSSVLMNVVPAQVAGVKEIVLISPPQKGSNPPAANNLILAAAGLLQKTAAKTKIEIYKVGGAQGIAALAFGTETVPKVDKIVGPGNLYVTLAKKLLYGLVGIDKLAGPSEVLVVADDSADAELVAAEILAQAEHDPDARAMLVSTSQKLIEAVSATVTVRCAGCRRKTIAERALKNNGWAVLAKSQTEMLSIANEIGAEHVVVMTKNATALSAQITNAGAIFIGAYSPVALGDYWAGPNHVLPTGGTARFSSPLGVWDFVKRQSVIHYSKAALKKAAADIEILAEGEGLEAHARSVKRVDQ